MSRRLRLLDNESGIVEVSSRTLHGRFLTRPSAEVNKLILGILGRAQAKYPVEIFAFVFLSNHFHLLMRASSAKRMAEFVSFVKSNIAKELGRLHDWKQTFWGGRYYSAPLADDSVEDEAARFMYILSNGCKEGLVASPLDWPGVSSAQALYRGETTMQGIWYDRTAEFHARIRGEQKLFPTVQTVHLSPLPFLAQSTPAEQREYMVAAIRHIEQETRERHKENGTRPLGARNIEQRNPHDSPNDFHPSPAPWFHCMNREQYRAMRAARAITVAAYREAAERLRRGDTDVEFPDGTFPPPAPFTETRAPP